MAVISWSSYSRGEHQVMLYDAFHANPLHELESMWWLLIWFVFSHIPESSEHLYDAKAVSSENNIVLRSNQTNALFNKPDSSTDTSCIPCSDLLFLGALA